MIRVDDEVYEFLNQRGRTEDTFNDVIRRELGLSPKKRAPQPTSAEPRVEVHPNSTAGASPRSSLIDKHLPARWNETPKRGDQILRVVDRFLRTPKTWETPEREVYAAKQVAQGLGVEVTTVQDKCTRQLFGEGDVMQNFHRALEAIEADMDKTPAPGAKPERKPKLRRPTADDLDL